MKKVFKIFLWFFCGIMGLLLLLIIFLFSFYNVLEKKQNMMDKELESRSKTISIPADTIKNPFNTVTLNLIPVPQKVEFTPGHFVFPPALVYSVTDSLKNAVRDIIKMIPDTRTGFSPSGENIQFKFNKDVPVQGYIMDIKTFKITVEYSNRQGLYYALVSLKVLKQNYSGNIPCVRIEDSPDLAVRGLMLDISRDKVPTIKTLTGIVQLIADLKYNHFELYVEGFSFAYPSFKDLWEGKETPLTGEEIRSLDSLCRAYFIDFVPNQNSLGHMMAWLATDKYKDLAECPNGYKILGLMNMKSTLDPRDPGSIDLVTKMTDDLLPNFTSSGFNVNLDEPFELGKGKSKELCGRIGEGQVYLDYALKMHDLASSRNKKMFMWGDIVLKHPELISRIPKDITLLDWGYESSYPYERHCKTLQSSGLNYMVCPGTNSWTSITGRTDNMLATVEVATANAVKYGARGMLITDWGDMGHWQYLPVSYAGYTAGGALSWNSKSRKDMPLSTFLNSYVFRDKSSTMGNLALDMGRYNRYEGLPLFNMTTTMLSLEFGLRDKLMINAIFEKLMKGIGDLMKDIAPEMVTALKEKSDSRQPFDYSGLQKFLDSEEALLRNVRITTNDSSLIRDEYLNAIKLIRLGAGLQKYIQFRGQLSDDEQKSLLKPMKDMGKEYLAENHRLWLLRNKPGGYDRSTSVLNTLLYQIDTRLELLDKSFISRGWNRFLEKLGTAGAVLYMRST
jgi:hexosaminidase